MTVRLLCDAIPFCYGPAAALDNLLMALVSLCPDLRVDVLVSGTSAELLRRSSVPIRLISIDSEDSEAMRSLPFASYDAFLNVCNPVSYSLAKQRGARVAYVDFLLWMHTGEQPDHFDADLYLAENYPGTVEWIERRGGEIANLRLVPPLVRPAERRNAEAGLLLIGLGGLYSRLTVPGHNTDFAPYVIDRVLAAIPPGRFSRVLIAGPEGITETVQAMIGGRADVEYESLGHEQFLDALARAEAFVSHPGLYAAFEAILGGVPTAFLPPSNYTQVLQLRHYRRLGLADYSFAWEDAGLPAVPAGLAETDGVRAVLSVVDEAQRSPPAAAALEKMLNGFFLQTSASLQRLASRQKAVASVFGHDGPTVTARLLLDWLLQPARVGGR